MNYCNVLFLKRDLKTTFEEDELLISIESYKRWGNNVLQPFSYHFGPEEDGYSYDFDELDSNNSNSGNEKYGRYNGFNDDTIDNAFEGDPVNTWNVD